MVYKKDMMGRRHIWVSLILLIFSVSVFGKAVSKSEVEEAVYSLLFKWNRQEGVKIQQMEERYLSDGTLGYYMVDLGEDGWVMVSADDVIRPIIAFSFEKEITPESEWGDAASYLLGTYKQEIAIAIKDKSLKRDERWDRPELPSFQKSAMEDVLEPIIDVTWNQGGGWNMFCPADEDGPSGHAYVGCVAVAMAQAMSVYEYPAAPAGIKSYVHEDYGSIAVNFDKADPYQWKKMSRTQADSFNAILLYHCAVSVEMGFGADGSGAYVRTAASSMSKYFGYSNSMSFKERYEDLEEWEALLVNEIEAGRPVVYRGGPDDGTSGHAWNVDGYGDGYFHMNFGWSGSQNGYYTISLINPGTFDFSSDQGALIGIAPPVSSPYGITLSALSIEEGLPLGYIVSDVTVEDEDPFNVYEFTCKGKYNFLLREYEPAAFHIEDGKLLSDEVFVYDESTPDQNFEVLFILVEDQFGNEYKEEFQIDIKKVYKGPAGIALSDSSVMEKQAVGTAVAAIVIEDEDSGNSYNYTLHGAYNPDISDFDPASFYVENDTLKTAVVFDLGESNTCYVLVELEDSYGFVLSREFIIQIDSYVSGSTNMTNLHSGTNLVYPNPANQMFWFRDSDRYRSLEIFELSTGRKITSIDPLKGAVQVSQLSEGVYLLKVRTKQDEVLMQKMIIRH